MSEGVAGASATAQQEKGLMDLVADGSVPNPFESLRLRNESARAKAGLAAHKDRDEARGLTPAAVLILRVDARAIGKDDEAEAEAKRVGRRRLAIQLGCTPESLQAIAETYGDLWQEYVLEERVRFQIESAENRDVSWDSLEYAVLKKLKRLVDADRVTGINELIAIAKVSNSANRGERKTVAGNGGVTVNQQNNFLPGSIEDGILPSGNLGRINLNLTPRFMRQIDGTSQHLHDSDGNEVNTGEGAAAPQKSLPGRILDSVDMLTVREIQDAGDQWEKDRVAEKQSADEAAE